MEQAATYREVFGNGEFRVLFGSFVLQVAGDTVKNLALSVLVYERSGSPGLAALAYMLGFLPYILGGTFLLSLADRVRPRTLMAAGQALLVAVCLVLAYAGLPVWAMLLVVFGTGLFSPLFAAARNAVLPELLPGDAFVLARSLMVMAAGGAQIGGLATGGALLAVTGATGGLTVTAGLSAVALLLVRFGLPDRAARTSASTPGGASGSASGGASGGRGAVRETLRVNRVLMADRRVRGLMLVQWLPVAFVAGAEAVFVPYLSGPAAAGSGAAGIALAAAAAGMAAGNFAVGRLVTPAGRERLALPLAVWSGVPLLAFVLRPGLAATVVLAALATLGTAYLLGVQRPFLDAVPEPVRGQAYGLAAAGQMTAQGLGAALAGGLAELVPAHLAVAAAGLGAVLASLCLAAHLRPRPVAAAPGGEIA
ncbi:membrane protein [Microtetraspora sp. NBRC 13810]|uniref:MFS transporter n=1 Tax=Microtetraspora sp. NBRC 13810 TaxID=3030990 RepID=UPI0024A571C1|nr:MFS transporter [Microtetraspora sp. NBRC 13810]GLW05670.1 membrane protein [Microtetraspora sp. NBRC 13810]